MKRAHFVIRSKPTLIKLMVAQYPELESCTSWVMAGKEDKPAYTPFGDPIGTCVFNRF